MPFKKSLPEYQKAHFQFIIDLCSYSSVRFRANLLAICDMIKLTSVRETRIAIGIEDASLPWPIKTRPEAKEEILHF